MGKKNDLSYFLDAKESTGKWNKKTTDTPKPSVRQILGKVFSAESVKK